MEVSGRATGGWSEVWALHVGINEPCGFDLWEYGDLNWLSGDLRAMPFPWR